MKIKLTKISDCENPRHPNAIIDGYTVVGDYTDNPREGDVMQLEHCDTPSTRFHTSQIAKIIDHQTFQTRNSIYKWELIPEEDEKDIPDIEVIAKAVQYVAHTRSLFLNMVMAILTTHDSEEKAVIAVNAFMDGYKIAMKERDELDEIARQERIMDAKGDALDRGL